MAGQKSTKYVGENDWMRSMFQQLNEFRRDTIGTDFTMQLRTTNAKGQPETLRFPVHKCVLAAASPYFRDLIKKNGSKDKEWSIDDQGTVFAESKAIQSILDFVYTSEICLTESNCEPVLAIAYMLQIKVVIDKCELLLIANLDRSHWCRYLSLSNFYKLSQLQSAIDEYVCENLSEVAATDDFLELSSEQMTRLVIDQRLRTLNETDVIDAILRWTNGRLDERKQSLSTLMKNIRWSAVDRQYVRNHLLSNELIKTQCPDVLFSLLDSALTDDTSATKSNRSNSSSVVVVEPPLANSLLMAVGGSTTDTIAFDFQRSEWRRLRPLPEAAIANGVTVLDKKTYSIGGCVGYSKPLATVWRYELDRNEWISDKPLPTPRSFLSAATLDGRLYVAGGKDKASVETNLVQAYDPRDGRWRRLKPMHQSRMSHGMIAVGDQSLYVVGGCSNNNGSMTFPEAELYDSRANAWTPAKSPNTLRYGHATALVQGKILICGGIPLGAASKTAEIIDPLAKPAAWTTTIGSLNVERVYSSAGVVANAVFLVGGEGPDGKTGTSVEVLWPGRKDWELFPHPMPELKTWFGVAVLD